VLAATDLSNGAGEALRQAGGSEQQRLVETARTAVRRWIEEVDAPAAALLAPGDSCTVRPAADPEEEERARAR
jgi:hypothetical protein